MGYKIVIPSGQDVPWQVTELITKMGVEYWIVEDD